MLKKRLIPILLIKDGFLVKSVGFSFFQILGKPKNSIERYNLWSVDEIIILDITDGENYDLGRLDIKENIQDGLSETISFISNTCFVPLTVGGGVRTVEDIRSLLAVGADKVTVNTQAIEKPEFIQESSKLFGSQCIVVSIDAKLNEKGEYEVFSHWGKKGTGMTPIQWAKEVESLGAGEILLTSIDKNGSKDGYQMDLIKQVADSVKIPVIANGGAGEWEHMVEVVEEANASAVAAANIFYYSEQSTKHAKKFMVDSGLDVRIG